MDADISAPASSSALTLTSDDTFRSTNSGAFVAGAVRSVSHNPVKSGAVSEHVHSHNHIDKTDAVELSATKLLGFSSPALSNCSSHSGSPIALSPSSQSSSVSSTNTEMESKEFESETVDVADKSEKISSVNAANTHRIPHSQAHSHSHSHAHSAGDTLALKSVMQHTTASGSPSNSLANFRSSANNFSANNVHSPTLSSSSPSYSANSSSGMSNGSASGGIRSKLKDRLKHSQSEQRRRSRLRERFDYLAQLLAQTKATAMPLDWDGNTQTVDEKSMLNERRDRFTVLNSAIERLHAFNRKVNSMHREMEKLKRNCHSPTNAGEINASPMKMVKAERGNMRVSEAHMEEEDELVFMNAPIACGDSSLCFGDGAQQMASVVISAVKRNPHAACTILRGAPFIRVDCAKQQVVDCNAAWKEIHQVQPGDHALDGTSSGSATTASANVSTPSPSSHSQLLTDNVLTAMNSLASSGAAANCPLQIVPISTSSYKPSENGHGSSDFNTSDEFAVILSRKENGSNEEKNDQDVLGVFLPLSLVQSPSNSPSRGKRVRSQPAMKDTVSISNRIQVKNEEDESKPAKRARKQPSAPSPSPVNMDNTPQMSVYPASVQAATNVHRFPTSLTGPAHLSRSAYLTGDGLVYEPQPAAIYDSGHEGATGAIPAMTAYLPGHYPGAATAATGLSPYGLVSGGRYMNTAMAYDMWHPASGMPAAYGAPAPYYARPLVRPSADAGTVRYYPEASGAAYPAYSNTLVDPSVSASIANGSGNSRYVSSSAIRSKLPTTSSPGSSGLSAASVASLASVSTATTLSSSVPSNSVVAITRSTFK